MPFKTIDVSQDQAAAQEIVRRTGQMGVPVITAGEEVIVGFDQKRLQQLAQRVKAGRKPRLGLLVKDVPGGAEVGTVRPDTAAARAGVRVGDVVESFNGQPVRSVANLERMATQLQPGQTLEIGVRRGSEHLKLRTTT